MTANDPRLAERIAESGIPLTADLAPSRARRRINVHHVFVADSCRANPGVWLRVGEYNSSQSAEGIAESIRKAKTKSPAQQSPYGPAGSFEARRALTEYGARVEARYVGVSDDMAWTDALAGLTPEQAS
ncbi:hypothetical protein [Streptomyces sp. SAS_275]|uniref:hypothetical protein n=1 Tax=Streptomyces sp. SAS_275 TaxID=3412746 RepID=UPI00403D046F